jgi:hypothetical protein
MYWYHSFDGHNDEQWYYIYDRNRKSGYGGFTIAFDPELKVATIAVCSDKDRFSRRVGRDAAQRRYRIMTGYIPYNGSTWFILAPDASRVNKMTKKFVLTGILEAVEQLCKEHKAGDISLMTTP